MSSPMNMDFYEAECIEDVLMDLFIDQLHSYAEMQLEEDLELTTSGSVAQMDRATAF